jgi:hypothetical protein
MPIVGGRPILAGAGLPAGSAHNALHGEPLRSSPFTLTCPLRFKYSEGLQVGYKRYDAQDKVPLLPFGHGSTETKADAASPPVALAC